MKHVPMTEQLGTEEALVLLSFSLRDSLQI